MQRCCSGSGRAHTHTGALARHRRHRHPCRHRRTGTAASGRGEQGRREGRPRGPEAGLAPAHRLGQRPPAPANTLPSPQVCANCFCLLRPRGGGGGSGRCCGQAQGLRLSFLATWEGAGAEQELPQAEARLTSYPAPGGWGVGRRSPPPCLCGWHPAGAWQASLARRLDPSSVQEFQPAPAPAQREASGSGACPALGSRARPSMRPSPRLWPARPPPRSAWVELNLTIQT